MRKLLCGILFWAAAVVVPVSTMAEVNIGIGISLPPPIVFEAPPEVIVLPDTNDVYVAPSIEVDLFFWNGWWWRLWEGRWYRSHYYNRGWVYYRTVPSFYFDVDPGWRGYYRGHDWHGHRWDYEQIPNRQLQQNWRTWHNERHWEKQRTWGVQNYQRRPQHETQELRRQRQDQYRQRPEVQRHQQQMREQQRPQQKEPRLRQHEKQRQPQQQQQMREQHRQPQVQQPQRQRQPQQQQMREQHKQPQGQKQQGESKHQKSQGKPERGDEEHRK